MSQKKQDQNFLANQSGAMKKDKSKHRHTCCGRCKNCKCNTVAK